MELQKFTLGLFELGIKTRNSKISKKLKKFLFEKIYGFSFPSKKIVNKLEELKIPYMITGGIAVSF